MILIEFEHQNGIFLGNDEPSRNHIHAVVRTPNGNDYGKNLLRQPRERLNHSQWRRSAAGSSPRRFPMLTGTVHPRNWQ